MVRKLLSQKKHTNKNFKKKRKKTEREKERNGERKKKYPIIKSRPMFSILLNGKKKLRAHRMSRHIPN